MGDRITIFYKLKLIYPQCFITVPQNISNIKLIAAAVKYLLWKPYFQSQTL